MKVIIILAYFSYFCTKVSRLLLHASGLADLDGDGRRGAVRWAEWAVAVDGRAGHDWALGDLFGGHLGQGAFNGEHALGGEARLEFALGKVDLGQSFGQDELAVELAHDGVFLVLDVVGGFNDDATLGLVHRDGDFFGLVATEVEAQVDATVAFTVQDADWVGQAVEFNLVRWAESDIAEVVPPPVRGRVVEGGWDASHGRVAGGPWVASVGGVHWPGPWVGGWWAWHVVEVVHRPWVGHGPRVPGRRHVVRVERGVALEGSRRWLHGPWVVGVEAFEGRWVGGREWRHWHRGWAGGVLVEDRGVLGRWLVEPVWHRVASWATGGFEWVTAEGWASGGGVDWAG